MSLEHRCRLIHSADLATRNLCINADGPILVVSSFFLGVSLLGSFPANSGVFLLLADDRSDGLQLVASGKVY